jgi:hypothetical protein
VETLLRIPYESNPGRTIIGAEIGVFHGDTSHHILANFPRIVWLMIDPWEVFTETRKGITRPCKIPQEKWDAMAATVENTTREYPGRRVIMRLSSVEAASLIADNSLDIAFLDANHYKPAVAKDLPTWWPKIRKGGIFACHDYGEAHPELMEAVDEWAADTGVSIQQTSGRSTVCWAYK